MEPEMQDVPLSAFTADPKRHFAQVASTGNGMRLVRPGGDVFMLIPETEYRRLERELDRLGSVVMAGRRERQQPAFNGEPSLQATEDAFSRDPEPYLTAAANLSDVLIHRPGEPNAILLSEQSFGGIRTTIQIYSDPEYARHLLDSAAESDQAATAAASAAE